MSEKVEIQVYGQDTQLTPQQEKLVEDVLLKRYNRIAKVGDYLLDSDGLYGRITGFVLKEHPEKEKDERWTVQYKIEGIRYKGESQVEERYMHKYTPWSGTLEELKEQARKMMLGEIPKEKPAGEQNPQGLMSFDKETFTTLKRDLVLRNQEMKSKMTMMKALLENKMYQLRQVIEPLQAEIARVTKIIWTIELYLGIREDIELIQDGKEASIDEPIHFMQERLYMDEEVGDPTNDGLDFNNIEDFFQWLKKFNEYFQYHNYKLLLPYEKSVRIMKVRRNDKNYNDPWVNFRMNQLNEITVLLIRNGERIYCIQTDMDFGDKLFPMESELMDLRDKILKDTENVLSRNGRKMDDEYREEIVKDKMTGVVDKYKRNLIIMQGLIDRTEVFGKLFGIVNIMNTSALTKGQVIFEYDADLRNQIGDGDMEFHKRFEQMRKEISKGTRVLWNEKRSYYGKDEKDRFFREHRGYYSIGCYPRRPDDGLYELDSEMYDPRYSDRKMAERFFFHYLPTDEVFDEEERQYRPRKKRSAYRVYENECVNPDFFSWRDIDWIEKMFHDRRLRKHYLQYMYDLKTLKEFKEKELEQEKPFAELLVNKTGKSIEEVMDAIHWWKTKNKYKRAITVDDAKAFRMIQKQLEK
jgi:hypothetical protein